MDVQVVGVIGAGEIGIGVVQNLAQTGHDVILVDVSEQRLNRSKDALERNIRFQRFFQRAGATVGLKEALERVNFTTSPALLKAADFVVENVTEKWDVKRDVYTTIDGICPAATIFAANTSAIPITRLASLTKRPAQFIGMHFMIPVPLKPTVEVIRGYHTSDETLARAQSLLARMGKDCVVVGDSPGFVSNRVLMLTINEAIFLVHERIAAAEDVDRIFVNCFGHKMGPLATADLIGLDTVLFSLDVLYDSFRDGKYRACPLLRNMVDAGLRGRKSGQGFYTYDRLD
jgi:3-hydroxybutyryl-CoA dehydrogenase